MTKLTLTEQEELFARDCKLINLRYEYTGYTGKEKWAIVTELKKTELLSKYPNVITRYLPFVLLSVAQGEVITEYKNNEARERMRQLRYGCYFDINDADFDEHHAETAVDSVEDYICSMEERQHLLMAMSNLSETQKRRVIKYYLYDKSLAEIADEEGIDFTSVRESVNSAIKKIKKFL